MKRIAQLTSATIIFLWVTMMLSAGTASTKTGTAKPSDDAVKTVLEQRLSNYGLMSGNNIQIAVTNGIIALKGTVRSLDNKDKAGKYAHEVEDSYTIDNQLTIQPGSLSDQQMTDSVRHEINNYVLYSIFDWVEVQVKDGVVTLSGWVYESWHKPGYEKQARKAPGVKQVINNLQELPVSFTDDHLRHQAADLIYDDAFLYKYAYGDVPTIHIIVNMGVVTLMGMVDSKYDADRATSLVNYRTDAFAVVDDLQYKRVER
jgi:hyperosmotically inducible protein